MIDRLYRRSRYLSLAASIALLSACGGGGSANSVEVEPFYVDQAEEWELVWSDEFDGATVDSANWTFQEGDGSEYGLPGWGNNELQYYEADNASIQTVNDASALVIAAEQETVGNKQYTSARMRSIDKFDFKYGRVEIRAKAAPGEGMWSSVWMMPSDDIYGTWAAGGEVDIMEVVNAGTDRQTVFLAAHHGFSSPLNQVISEPADVNDASDWHTYALEWSGDYLRWFVDGVHLQTVDKDAYYSYYYKSEFEGYALAADPAAPFNQDFHLIVNLAVGGIGPGVPLDPSAVPGEMAVDYIRVFRCTAGGENGVGCNSKADRYLESPEVTPPEVNVNPIYVDAAGPLTWDFLTGEVTRDLMLAVGYDNNGAMSVSEVAVDGRGNVIDVMTTMGGNVVIHAADGEVLDVFGHRGGGELKFDMYIDSAMTAPFSSVAIKMDSGFPALGSVDISLAELPKDEWFSYSVSISDLLDNPGEAPLALGAVMNVFVIEPSNAAHIQLDNISLVCGTPYTDGCGIAAPVQETDAAVVTVLDDNGEAGSAWSPGICAVSSEDWGTDYCSGSTTNQVTWSVMPSGDADIGTAIEVNFAAGEGAAWFIVSDVGLNLSTFRTAGSLRFDMNIPEATAAKGLIYKVESVFPNGTGRIDLDLTGHTPGTWQSFDIPVSELLASTAAASDEFNPGGPLDIERVKAGIVISPIGEQEGDSFTIANVRYERDAQEATEDTGILGTWMVEPGVNTIGIGPTPFDVQWWSNTEVVNTERACFFDDQYIFGRDGSFTNVLGDTTWIEGWQASEEGADICGTPVAPHDGSVEATFEFDEEAEMLTLYGKGAYMGLPKTVNGAELASPDAAPESTVYSAYLSDDRTSLDLVIEALPTNFWTYQFVKTAEPPPPSIMLGTWVTSTEVGTLGVGPAEFDTQWFNNTDVINDERACFFDDEFTFGADGTLTIDQQGETWIEGWQNSSEGADICGTPVAPHDGAGDFMWSHDQEVGELTLMGQGAYLGLPKVTNAGETASPEQAPETVTYNLYDNDDGTVTVTIQTQDSGNWWQHKMVKVAELPGESPIAGSWYLSTEIGSMGVGPAEFDTQWFNNTAVINDERACWFDDAYIFGADGSFAIDQQSETWIEGWQGSDEGADICGTPVAPHDGSAATHVYDADAETLTLQGAGAYIGLSKVTNSGELATPDAAPAELVYNAYLSEDQRTLTLTIQTTDTGNWWQFVLVR